MWRLLLLLPVFGVWADEIVLSTGSNFTGQVTAYTNLTFELLGETGKVTRQPSPYIKSITFTDREADSTFALRSGPTTGKLRRYEKSTFYYEDGRGTVRTLHAILVRSLSVPAIATAEDEASSGNELVIPDALSRGAPVEMSNLVVTGKVTVVFFFGNVDTAGVQCRLVNNFIDNVLKDDRRIVVRKMDIGEWDSPVAQQYKVTAIPRVDVYDTTGKLAKSIIGNRPPELMDALRRIR